MPLRAGMWDTHVHLLDPITYPYSANRTYTPPAASPERLLASSQATNFLLVQATVEADSTGLLEELKRLQPLHPGRIFRGAILVEDDAAQVEDLESSAKKLHDVGVRCVRIHGHFQSPSPNLTSKVTRLLSGPIATVARRYNWSISLGLPLESWADLEEYLDSTSSGLQIIAEHCGGLEWPFSESMAASFETFLSLLRKKLIYVKLGALHRRIAQGHQIADLESPIGQIVMAGPTQLLWGSDWPHVNPAAEGMEESDFLSIDENEELAIIQKSMSDQCFDHMLHVTPAALLS